MLTCLPPDWESVPTRLTETTPSRSTLSVLPEGVVSVNRVGTLAQTGGRQFNMHLVFEPSKLHACIYDTGFFPLQLCIRTHALENSLSVDGGCFDVDYGMEIGGQMTSRNRLKIVVTPATVLSKQETQKGASS